MEYFINYVWSFYGPNKIYGKFFNDTLTKEEIKTALRLRLKNKDLPFDGDSIDREIVRDIILSNRGETNLEYRVK